MSGTIRRWAELKTVDFGQRTDTRIALLPIAAIEQHGPHLPLGTDSFIVEAIIARLGDRLSDAADILVLPTQMVGCSPEHGDFPGTLSQDAETLIEAWLAIGEAVAESGIRKLAILNSHGGQPQIADIVAQRLRAEHGMLAVRINTFLLGVPEGLFDAGELRYGYHGGEIETAMMLAIAPELVDMDAAKNFASGAAKIAETYAALAADGGAAISWQAQDLNAEGVMGNAAAADAERGNAILDHIAAGVARALDEIAAFPLGDLRDGPP